ncbi:MAG: TolC family protein [Candidatus Marinimicrobia bacterium]|nr:TolC family protein [Candidatus Neomarinimicrobiota bacterium]
MVSRHYKPAVILFLFWVISLTLQAQESPPAELRSNIDNQQRQEQEHLPILTEEQLITRALQRSRKLRSLQTNIDIAEYRYQSSGRLANPELRFRDISLSHHEKKYQEQQIGLRFSIPQPGELQKERQESAVLLWDKKVDKERYHQTLIARVRRDVANVIMYDQLLDLTSKRVALEDRRIGIIENMVGIGERSVVYFTKAKMRHAESKNDYARAKQKRIQARYKLSKDTGVDMNVRIMASAVPEISAELTDLITIALENRPEVELVKRRIELANYQKKFERYKVLPGLDFLEVNYHAEREGRADWVELMMGIDLPLLDWNRGNRQATELAVKKKELEYDALYETISDEVSTAYATYRDLFLDWNNFQRDAEKLISEATNVVEQARMYNTLLPDEVLEMELTIIDTQTLLAKKRCNLMHAYIELQYALGTSAFVLPVN